MRRHSGQPDAGRVVAGTPEPDPSHNAPPDRDTPFARSIACHAATRFVPDLDWRAAFARPHG